MTFPRTPEGKREALRLMQSTAPDLMADIAALREQWGGQLTYFKAGGLEYGTPSPEGWQVDEALINRVHPPKLTAEQRERSRKEKLAANRRKSKRK